MAIGYLGNGSYVGLSSDTKPTTSSLGYRFYETDTGDNFISDGTYWWLQGIPGPLSTKRFGFAQMGSSGAVGTGMMSTWSAATATGSQNFVNDTTNGRYLQGTSGTTIGNKGGFRVPTALAMRMQNVRMRFRFKLVTTALQNVYFGFIGNANPPAEPTGIDPFGSGSSGIVFGHISGATNFEILSNDTTGATVVTSTGTALDTAVHTVSLVADEPNSRFSWKLDGGTYNHLTTDIPANFHGLSACFQNECNESGVAKSFQFYGAFIQADR